MIEQVAVSIAASIVYSSVHFAQNRIEKGEDFDLYEFTSTIVIGMTIGVFAALSSYSLTYGGITYYMAANIGIISIAESIIRTITSLVKSSDILSYTSDN